MPPSPHTFLRIKKKKKKKKKKRKAKEKSKSFKVETVERLSPRSKYWGVWASKIFLVGQSWGPTIFFSLPWSLYFAIHIAVPANG